VSSLEPEPVPFPLFFHIFLFFSKISTFSFFGRSVELVVLEDDPPPILIPSRRFHVVSPPPFSSDSPTQTARKRVPPPLSWGFGSPPLLFFFFFPPRFSWLLSPTISVRSPRRMALFLDACFRIFFYPYRSSDSGNAEHRDSIFFSSDRTFSHPSPFPPPLVYNTFFFPLRHRIVRRRRMRRAFPPTVTYFALSRFPSSPFFFREGYTTPSGEGVFFLVYDCFDPPLFLPFFFFFFFFLRFVFPLFNKRVYPGTISPFFLLCKPLPPVFHPFPRIFFFPLTLRF